MTAFVIILDGLYFFNHRPGFLSHFGILFSDLVFNSRDSIYGRMIIYIYMCVCVWSYLFQWLQFYWPSRTCPSRFSSCKTRSRSSRRSSSVELATGNERILNVSHGRRSLVLIDNGDLWWFNWIYLLKGWMSLNLPFGNQTWQWKIPKWLFLWENPPNGRRLF